MVHVKLHNLLAERSLTGEEGYDVAYTDGMTAADVIHREGWYGDEEEAIVVIVNDEQAKRETRLRDGDRLELMIGMVGG